MPQSLRIRLKDGTTIDYRYEHGLQAVREALETELGPDFDYLEVDRIEVV